jgi:hypothetical protein
MFSAEDRRIRKLEQERGEAEEWRPAPGLVGRYEISSFGRVLSVRKNKIVKGDPKVIPSLVARAFLPRKSSSFLVKHRDGDRTNNYHKNLYWFARAFTPTPIRKLVVERARKGDKHARIAFDVGLSEETVGVIAREEGVSSEDLHRLLSDEEIKELIGMVDAGLTYPVIAEALGVAPETVGVHYRAAGKVSPRYKTDLLSDARLEIAQRFEAGENRTLLAAEFGISRPHARAIWLSAKKRGLI